MFNWELRVWINKTSNRKQEKKNQTNKTTKKENNSDDGNCVFPFEYLYKRQNKKKNFLIEDVNNLDMATNDLAKKKGKKSVGENIFIYFDFFDKR